MPSAPVPVKNAIKAKSSLESSRRFVVAGFTGKKAAIRVPNDPLRMSGIKFLRRFDLCFRLKNVVL
jgi:hypothetical protein